LKIVILSYLEEQITDNDLTFKEKFIPETFSSKYSDVTDSIIFSIPKSYEGELKNYKNAEIRTGSDDIIFWKNIFNTTKADHVIKILTDTPFADINIIKEMLTLHVETFAEFTYSENLPQGFACEIISSELVSMLPDTEQETLSLSKVVKSNINQFDVELFYKDPDIRNKRISFRSSIPRDKLIMEKIYAVNNNPTYTETAEIVQTKPEICFITPSYIEVELTGNCTMQCIFCCRDKLSHKRENMNPDLYKKLLSDMNQFNLPYTVCLGGVGEPLLHENINDLLKFTITQSQVERLIIETNGIHIDNKFIEIMESPQGSKISVIVNINGYNNETYLKIHGQNEFDKALFNIERLAKFNTDSKKVYLQIMKINETEEYLDTFYDFWEEKNFPIILQKQNTYLGLIEDRRYSDLTPIDRTPCWHLLRDIFVLADGKVPFCKQDINCECQIGNANEESLQDIFSKMYPLYEQNFKGDYPKKPNCADCDEWYTYNF
jgi:spiro-SPASM protein